MTAQTISRFSRVYVNFDPDGAGTGGPPVWVLGSAGDGTSGTSVLSTGVYQPAVGNAVAEVGVPLYFRSPGVLDLAQARDGSGGGVQPYQVVGLAAASTSAGGTVGLITDGRISRRDWTSLTGSKALEPGQRYYLSPGYAGRLQSVCPSNRGDTVISVGQALSIEVLEVEITYIARL